MIDDAAIHRAEIAYGHEAWIGLLKNGRQSLVVKRSYKENASTLLGTVRIQDISSLQAGITRLGFEELQRRLAFLSGTVLVVDFDSPRNAGRCVFSEDGYTLIGCSIVEKRTTGLRTPPNWDGSKEMLDSFNKKP